jgi:hypothetical protein
MYSTAERRNVNLKSIDCVLTHQQHPSMATRPDNLTVPFYRLDAILERKFEMMYSYLLLLKVKEKFKILTFTIMPLLYCTLEICRINASNLTRTEMAVLTGTSSRPLWTTTRWKYGLRFLGDITRCVGSRCRSHTVLATKLHDAIYV